MCLKLQFTIASLINSLPASSNKLMLIFANSLDPDQARQNVEPEQDPKLFDTLIVFPKDFPFKKKYFEKNSTVNE